MKVNLNLITAFQNFTNFIHENIDLLSEKIKIIWDQSCTAYRESSKHVPKLVLPAHPIPNTYPKNYKYKDWPRYLDNAWGKWGNSDYLDNIAQKAEPLEKVTPLHATTLGDNIPGIYRLIANGAPVDAEDIRGQTPAYWAAYFGNIKALTLFKIYGADLNRKDFRGKAILRAAAKYGYDNVISFLVSQKVDINALDGKGLTPLHVAAFKGRFSAYEKLIFYGADRTIKDRFGRTAEDILKMKYAEMYHNRCFLFRLFSSPNPPNLFLKQWNINSLREKIS